MSRAVVFVIPVRQLFLSRALAFSALWRCLGPSLLCSNLDLSWACSCGNAHFPCFLVLPTYFGLAMFLLLGQVGPKLPSSQHVRKTGLGWGQLGSTLPSLRQLGPLSFNLDSSWPCLEGNFSPEFNTGPTWEPAENANFCWYFLFSGMEEVRARPCPPCQVHVGPSLGPTWWTAFAAQQRNTTACYHHFFFNICSARQTNVCAKVWETSSCTCSNAGREEKKKSNR